MQYGFFLLVRQVTTLAQLLCNENKWKCALETIVTRTTIKLISVKSLHGKCALLNIGFCELTCKTNNPDEKLVRCAKLN